MTDDQLRVLAPYAGGAAAAVFAAAALALNAQGPAPEAPATPVATPTATVLKGNAACKEILTRFTGKDGAQVELVLPPGCSLRPR